MRTINKTDHSSNSDSQANLNKYHKRARHNNHIKARRQKIRKMQIEKRYQDQLYDEARLDPETLDGQIKLDIERLISLDENSKENDNHKLGIGIGIGIKEDPTENEKTYLQYLYDYLFGV